MSDKRLENPSKKKFREIIEYAVHYRFCYCYLCGEPILPGQEWNLDHVKPRAKGGKSELYNLRPTHYECNQAKADMSLGQFRQMQEYLAEKGKKR